MEVEPSVKPTRTELDDNLLKAIEELIKGRKENFVSFSKTLKKKLFSIAPKEDILKRIKEIFTFKRIYFLRHFNAEHTGKKNFDAIDSKLTEEGVEQGKEFIKLFKENPIAHDLIFISPLRRTLGTFVCVAEVFDPNIDYIVTDLIRERLNKKMKNTGMMLNDLKEYCKETGVKLNTEFITKNNWWIDDDWEEYLKGNMETKEEHEAEDENGFKARVYISLLWSIFRKEQSVAYVSHSKVYKAIGDGRKIKNGIEELFDSDLIQEKLKMFFDDNEIY